MADISRYLQQFSKHYSTVHMQQGRVIIDSDWNERALAEAEDRRGFFADIMCAHGTPNNGMLITDPAATTVSIPGGPGAHKTYTFNIQPGSYYVGGLRFVVDAVETYLTQPDWLQINSAQTNVPAQVLATGGDRTDLVYLHCWEQSVTAIEDSELREVALGGRDTTTRVKRMRRFEVLENTPSDCAAAFTTLTGGLTAGNVATFDTTNNELVSLGRLQVSYDPANAPEDLCGEQSTNGYMGADNQAIRVELRSGGKLVWGFDNASKLYRVTVGDTNDEVVFLDEPRDFASMLRVGEVVEILRWGAKLPNDEKVAEQQGALFKVDQAYDAKSKKLLLDAVIDSNWITWLGLAGDHYNGDDESPAYFYLRVWRRMVGDADLAELDHTLGPVALGSTGFSVDLVDDGLVGDYWIIGARTSTPDQVTPWDLDTAGGVAPHGPRRFFAPLATIFWDDDGIDTVTPTVSDCRIEMRQLCEGSCCTVTVGDGVSSFGTVSSLADAVALVSDGGKICVLPGVHVGTATLTQLSDVTIEGCGPNTVLVSPAPGPSDPATGVVSSFYDPVLNIVDCENLRIENLRIESHSATGVEIVRGAGPACENIVLEGLEIYATGKVDSPDGVFEYIAPCVTVLGASDVTVRDCALEMGPSESLAPAVLFAGTRLRLLDSTVVAPKYEGAKLQSPGGVNIGSGSYDVEILRCTIDGGWGYGVSLGTVAGFDTTDQNYPPTLTKSDQLGVDYGGGGDRLTSGVDDCIEYDPNGTKKDSEDSSHTIVWLPLGPIERVRIQDCKIRNMGLSGISTVEFFDSTSSVWTGSVGPVFLVAADIDISRNEIEGNVRLNFLPPWIATNYDICFGGVCLAASINAVIRDNHIHDNGVDFTTPICGVGLVAAQCATIEDNRIIDNGLPIIGDVRQQPVSGMRGGIAVTEVTPLAGHTFPTSGLTLPLPVEDYAGASPGPALIVRGNEVRQRVGRALMVRRGFGPITVTGNSFEAKGNDIERDGLLGASLRWRRTDPINKMYTRPMLGVTAEIIGLSVAIDQDWGGQDDPPKTQWAQWVQSDGVIVTGGNVMVTDNVFSLEWTKLEGVAASVLVSSLGSVVFDANSSSVVMNNPFGLSDVINVQKPNQSFMEQAFDEYQSMSLVLTNVYLGAHSIAQAVGNRLTEPQFDALFSVIAGSPVAHQIDLAAIISGDVGPASCLVANVGSHCCVGYTGGGLTKNNVAVYSGEDVACALIAVSEGVNTRLVAVQELNPA